MSLRRYLLLGATVILVAGAAWGATRVLGQRPQATSDQLVTWATRGSLTAAISPIGEVQPVQRAALGFDVTRIALLELHVSAGQQVAEGEVLARIDETSLQRALDRAEVDLLAAEEALEEASAPATEAQQRRAALDVAQAEVALYQAEKTLEDLVSPDLDSARAAVTLAEANLQSAELNLTLTQHSSAVGRTVRDLEYNAAFAQREWRDVQTRHAQGQAEQEAVDEAAAALADLEMQLASARSTAASNLADAANRVTQAQSALADAREDLATLRAGPDELTLAVARNRVAQAKTTRATAQDTLAATFDEPSASDLRLLQSRYDSALATWHDAQLALNNATLVAPFAGTVTAVGARVGDLVSSTTAVVTLADLTELRVLATVDETDIGLVQVGQEAEITFDALPGQRFVGEVLEVPLEGTLSQNIVTFTVSIGLQDAAGAALLPGMTANVRLVVGRAENALLLPVLAVQESDDGYVVLVQDPGQSAPVTTRVQIGLSDGQYVEVLRGLIEGDQVVVRLQAATTTQGGMGAFGAQAAPGGGAMPGGGGGWR